MAAPESNQQKSPTTRLNDLGTRIALLDQAAEASMTTGRVQFGAAWDIAVEALVEARKFLAERDCLEIERDGLVEQYEALEGAARRILTAPKGTSHRQMRFWLMDALGGSYPATSRCDKCKHDAHEPGACGVNVGTGYQGAVPCRCGAPDPATKPYVVTDEPDAGWNLDCWKGYDGCRCKVEDVHTSSPASESPLAPNDEKPWQTWDRAGSDQESSRDSDQESSRD